MSREERRQYQRMMKNMERGPALPPAARARAERNAARRARRQPTAPPGSFTRRFWIISVLLAALIGYVAFSMQWPEMPRAAYVGLGVGIVVLIAAVGARYVQRRAARKNSAPSN
jgi:Flp pilus assembly protein TadB